MKIYIVWERDSFTEPEVFTDPDEALINLAREIDKQVVIYEVEIDGDKAWITTK